MTLSYARQQVQRRNQESCVEAEDCLAVEQAIAIEYNGISFAVMMLSPTDLEAFVTGFSLSEGIVDTVADVFAIDCVNVDNGMVIKVEISSRCVNKLKHQVRLMSGRSGCGVCGDSALNLQSQILPSVDTKPLPTVAAINSALAAFSNLQTLRGQTGAVHAAAWCDQLGNIQCVNEDVGRHNALDKLIGNRAMQATYNPAGFALISSRASYEMVAKVARVNISSLVAMSAPTTLAVNIAANTGVNLIGFARDQQHVLYNVAGAGIEVNEAKA